MIQNSGKEVIGGGPTDLWKELEQNGGRKEGTLGHNVANSEKSCHKIITEKRVAYTRLRDPIAR
ncbi:hypothetical protein C5Y93_06415 [Blastopirellula marina]|uniref:Uncharacterized protein n=1 Tax=Blastopirellula marina TaxID=124 RepID=A0A2S8GQV4_9BACT|nr:hypothetical protein C5Y93_06415 [Blastopirellula marina]